MMGEIINWDTRAKRLDYNVAEIQTDGFLDRKSKIHLKWWITRLERKKRHVLNTVICKKIEGILMGTGGLTIINKSFYSM